MFVSVCRLELYLPGCASLKDKRALLRSLLDRLRRKNNLAVAEVEGQDLWQRSVLGLANVNSRKQGAEEAMAKVVRCIEREEDMEVISYELEVL